MSKLINLAPHVEAEYQIRKAIAVLAFLDSKQSNYATLEDLEDAITQINKLIIGQPDSIQQDVQMKIMELMEKFL